MSFFTLSDNKTIENANTFDLGGDDFEPMPNNTQLKAVIQETKWAEYEGQRYINNKWSVIDGEYKGRVLFQKIRVLDENPTKADKHKRMLAAIDANAGGKLMAAGVMPDDMSLSINLMNKPMAIIVAVWEINDKKGNWIKAVSSLNAPQQQQAPQPPTNAMSADFDPSIGF